MSEDKLEKEFEVYRDLAAQDKKIDVATLMIDALQKHQANLLPANQKRWAYLISLSLPPFGLLFAIKFYLSDKDDGQHAAIMCLSLTILSIVLSALFLKAMFASSGLTVQQVQQINPNEVKDLLQ
ncbi:MAG: hypothetical protein KW802_00345 [Candidatus Doudnabacteria bacterium]|nr:hypothetical protein [Candidatus Doudnabacteria bacterium]